MGRCQRFAEIMISQEADEQYSQHAIGQRHIFYILTFKTALRKSMGDVTQVLFLLSSVFSYRFWSSIESNKKSNKVTVLTLGLQ